MGAYQFKIVIKGSKPPIWRRVLVPQGITFEQLHQIIQAVFCWSDYHLYEFEFRTMGIRVRDDRVEEDFDIHTIWEITGNTPSRWKRFWRKIRSNMRG